MALGEGKKFRITDGASSTCALGTEDGKGSFLGQGLLKNVEIIAQGARGGGLYALEAGRKKRPIRYNVSVFTREKESAHFGPFYTKKEKTSRMKRVHKREGRRGDWRS